MVWLNTKTLLSHSILHPRYLAQDELWRLVKIAGPELQGNLLDVGCGKKPYVSLLPKVHWYVGVDVPTTMHGLHHVDVASTAVALPFCNSCFDSVLCTEVLEHVAEPMQALQEIARVIKPGGMLLLTVPFSEQLHEEPYDFFRYTKHGLIHLLKKSNWSVLAIYERGGTWLELGYRLSSFIYSTLGADLLPDGNLKPKLFLGPITILICAFVQIVALLLDRSWHIELSTIGYGVVAEKIAEVE